MRLCLEKVEKKPEEWREYQRLADFFSNAHSLVTVHPRHEKVARERYDQLHGYFFTR